MNKEDQEIRERFGHENPFRVPAGYFDQLAERVMSQLPERSAQEEFHSPSHQVTLRPWLYAAACTALVAVMGASFLFYHSSSTSAEEQTIATTSGIDSQYMEEAADYVMLDNAEIYACLADN